MQFNFLYLLPINYKIHVNYCEQTSIYNSSKNELPNRSSCMAATCHIRKQSLYTVRKHFDNKNNDSFIHKNYLLDPYLRAHQHGAFQDPVMYLQLVRPQTTTSYGGAVPATHSQYEQQQTHGTIISRKDLLRERSSNASRANQRGVGSFRNQEEPLYEDETAKKNLLINYVPWSRQAKKRSLTSSRYGASAQKRPTTAAMRIAEANTLQQDNNIASSNTLDEETIQRFNENTIVVPKKKSTASIISARSVVSRISAKATIAEANIKLQRPQTSGSRTVVKAVLTSTNHVSIGNKQQIIDALDKMSEKELQSVVDRVINIQSKDVSSIPEDKQGPPQDEAAKEGEQNPETTDVPQQPVEEKQQDQDETLSKVSNCTINKIIVVEL